MSDNDSTKQCISCGQVKRLDEFAVRSKPERFRTAKARRSSRCKECLSEYHRQYRERNREKLKQYRDSRYDPVLNAEKCKSYRENNKDELRRSKAEYHRRNAERIRAKVAQWVRDNPERADEIKRRYYTRKKNAGGECSSEIIWQMYNDQGGMCAYCEVPLFGEFHIEHMVPLSRGGHGGWENTALSCPSCNARKGAKTVEEFVSVIR